MRISDWSSDVCSSDLVVTGAQVNLNLNYSPALIPELSHLHVFVNRELIGSVQLVKEMAESRTVQLPANPVLFREDNEFLFKFIGHYPLGCEAPYPPTLWQRVRAPIERASCGARGGP